MSRTKKDVVQGVDWPGKLDLLAASRDKAEFWTGLSVQAYYSLKEVSEDELKRLTKNLIRLLSFSSLPNNKALAVQKG